MRGSTGAEAYGSSFGGSSLLLGLLARLLFLLGAGGSVLFGLGGDLGVWSLTPVGLRLRACAAIVREIREARATAGESKDLPQRLRPSSLLPLRRLRTILRP